MKKLSFALLLGLFGCVGIPANVQPVAGFRLENYLGRWYEIARLDHSFERGLTRVTAEYSMRGDGGVSVRNRGYDPATKTWKEAEGKAYFVKEPEVGFLKVSFFGPFYGSYIVFALDHENYQYALVSGPDSSYLWLLSRSPEMPDDVKQSLLAKAEAAGFDVSKVLFVEQQ